MESWLGVLSFFIVDLSESTSDDFGDIGAFAAEELLRTDSVLEQERLALLPSELFLPSEQ